MSATVSKSLYVKTYIDTKEGLEAASLEKLKADAQKESSSTYKTFICKTDAVSTLALAYKTNAEKKTQHYKAHEIRHQECYTVKRFNFVP